MVKYLIDDFTIVQSAGSSQEDLRTQAQGNCGPVTRIDCYQAPNRVHRACIYFCPDGCMLDAPRVDANGVIHLYCNTCQYPPIRDILGAMSASAADQNAAPLTAELFVYYNSSTDAGLHWGKDPFAQVSGGVSL